MPLAAMPPHGIAATVLIRAPTARTRQKIARHSAHPHAPRTGSAKKPTLQCLYVGPPHGLSKKRDATRLVRALPHRLGKKEMLQLMNSVTTVQTQLSFF